MRFPSYDSDQLISIIRNKRPVISTLKDVISRIVQYTGARTFLDPFSGSGIVSRTARQLGLQVAANDIEPFSFLVTYVYLSLSTEDLTEMFSSSGGVDAYYSMINLHGMYASHSSYAEGKCYLSRHYSPEDPFQVKSGKERLYYTPENAFFIDAVRDHLESEWLDTSITAAEKAVVLSSLLYQSSLKANISGTFTSYHKRFYNGEVPLRKRITDPIELAVPTLAGKSTPSGTVSQEDARRFLGSVRGDICFLDPPATAQQYGSAYHLLNTIALWQMPHLDETRDESGCLVNRGGIREDWKKTRSPFCSRREAYGAMHALLNAVDAPHVLLSYPDKGILSPGEIDSLLRMKYPSVTRMVLPSERRGGRQAKDGTAVEHLYIAGDSSGFYEPTGDGLERISLISEIEKMRLGVFQDLNEEVKGFSFISGSLVADHPDYRQYNACSLEELKTVSRLFEQHLIESSGDSLLHLCRIYTGSFDSLGGQERVRLEKKIISILRYMSGYEREAFRAILPAMKRYREEEDHLLSERITFSRELDILLNLPSPKRGSR